MGTAAALLNGVVSTLLLVGAPQTPSVNARQPDSVFHQDAEGIKRSASRGLPTESAVSMRYQIDTDQTGDAGARLLPRFGIGSAGTRGTNDDDAIVSILPRKEQSGSIIPAAAADLSSHADFVLWIQDATGLSERALGELLDVDRLTIRHWKAGRPIREAGLRRLLETKDVLERARRRYTDQANLRAWLYMPDSELGLSPERLLRQGDFDRARFLAVVAPSTVELAPSWAKRPVAPRWRHSLEDPEQPGEFVEDQF